MNKVEVDKLSIYQKSLLNYQKMNGIPVSAYDGLHKLLKSEKLMNSF